MDQVREIAKVIWVQRFWVLSVLGVLVGVVCWSMAASDIDSQFETRNSAIKSAFDQVQKIKSEQVHPNDEVNEAEQLEVAKQREAVHQVWKDLYERQSQVLTWPQALGPEFISYIETLKFGDPIKLAMRGVYQNYIERRFDGLLEIVQAQKLTSQNAGGFGGEYGGRGGARGEMAYQPRGLPGEPGVDDDYLVQWLDQGQVQQKLFFSENPSAIQIWVTQEDLWVYETLLTVIAKTNEARKSTRPDNTAVRVIVALEVGQSASVATVQQGNIFMPQSSGVGGMGGEYDSRGGGESEYRGAEAYRGGEMDSYVSRDGSGAEGGAAAGTALLNSRYLGDDGSPQPAGELATMGSLEFRQLPIRMQLLMDQRWLPQLLIECANSPLPVEVKHVRVNPNNALQGFGQTSGGLGGSRAMLENPDPTLADVEIKGVVYIYKEPNETVIGSPSAADTQVAAAGTDL